MGSDIQGYEAEPAEVAAFVENLIGDLLAEPDPLVRYVALCGQQALIEAALREVRTARGAALLELKAGHTWQQVADTVGLGTYQRAQQLAALASA